MKNMIVGGLAAAAVALGIAAAAPANADPIGFDPGSSMYGGGHIGDHDKYAFWNMMAPFDNGHSGFTPDTAEYFATKACGALERGASEGRVVNVAVDSGFPLRLAQFAVHGAEYHYCPAYF